MLLFNKVTSTSWVTDETKCQRALTSLNANFYQTAIVGPIYMMQVGSDYAAFPDAGDGILFHFDPNFNIVASVVWQ